MAHAFILTNIDGDLVWRRGNWFLPLDGLGGDHRQVTLFSTKRAVEHEVKRLRKRGYRLRVQRIERPPARRTLVEDPSTVTTFTYSRAGSSSFLSGSPEEEDLPLPMANGRPKQKKRRRAIANKTGGGS